MTELHYVICALYSAMSLVLFYLYNLTQLIPVFCGVFKKWFLHIVNYISTGLKKYYIIFLNELLSWIVSLLPAASYLHDVH